MDAGQRVIDPLAFQTPEMGSPVSLYIRRLWILADMIDRDGYRLNVGIILLNQDHRVFWARRIGMRSWQFPQGGIKRNEGPEEAMYRELYEEVGLKSRDVQLIGRTRGWLHYDLPERYIRKRSQPLCIGQKQVWFMLELMSPESKIKLDCSGKPEFDSWTWVDYWHPVADVVYFKREVYHRALTELRGHVDGSEARCLSNLAG